MGHQNQKLQRIIAIDPTTKGFGFAVMEGPEDLIDWGIKEVKDKKGVRCLQQVVILINHYMPDVVVLEDYTSTDSRRCYRVQKLIIDIIELATTRHVKTCCYSISQVKEVFSQFEAQTKHQIAEAIAKCLPELAPRLPPERKPWMPEDPRMSIFDAAAFGLTYFHYKKRL